MEDFTQISHYLTWPIKQWPEMPVVLKVFSLVHIKILYQGPTTWNSLPVTITSLSSFPNLKKKTARVFSKIITELATLHTTALYKPGYF